MNEQMSFVEFPELIPDDNKFCFDNDINQIVIMLDEICAIPEVNEIEREWSVWEHIPRLGYRLEYHLTLQNRLPDEFFTKLNKVIRFAKSKSIDLSPNGLHYFSSGSGMLHIFSVFSDDRKKIKLYMD